MLSRKRIRTELIERVEAAERKRKFLMTGVIIQMVIFVIGSMIAVAKIFFWK